MPEQEQVEQVPQSVLDRHRQERSQLQTSMSAAANQSPDAEAEIQTLSTKTGLAPDLVRRNLQLVRTRAAETDPAAQTLLQNSPKTAQYLSTPSNAAVASDDHQSLSTIEQIFNVPRSAVGEAGVFVGGGIRGVGNLLDTGARAISPPGYWPKGEKGPIADLLDQLGSDLQFRAQQHIPPPEQQNAVTEFAGAFGQFGAAVLAGILGPWAPVLLFSGSGAQSKSEEFRMRGIAPGSVTEDLAMLANAGVYGFTGEFGLAGVMKNVPPSLRGKFLQYVADVGLAGGKQGLAMAAQGALSNVITKIAIDHDQEITQGLMHDMKLGGVVGAVARMIFRMSVPMMPPEQKAATKVLAAKEQLKALGAALKDSPLQKRSPETMSTFVAHATEGEKRYINPRDIIQYATGSNLDPARVADEMLENGGERLAQALDGGEDIVVPVSEYAARIATLDHQTFFDENSRYDPEVMSAEELKATTQAAAEAIPPEEQAQQETIQANLEQLQSPEVSQAIDQQLGPPEAAPEAAPDFWQGVEDRARQRLQERGTLTGERLGAGLPIEDIADVMLIGAAKIAKGVRDFTAWSAEMVAEYGPKIKPKLREIYDQALAEATRLRPPAEASVSTRVPTAVKATEDPLTERLTIGLEAMQQDPVAFEKNATLVASYPNYKPDAAARTPEAQVDRFIESAKRNILWLHDQMAPETRERAKQWYVGARRIIDDWSVRFEAPDHSIAAVIAVLSPQKDWFMNVSLAERVLDIWKTQQDFRWTDAMSKTAGRIFADPKFKPFLDVAQGATLGEAAASPLESAKALWLRVYDETYNPRRHRIITPEGAFADFRQTKQGVDSQVAWQNLSAIGKAIAVIEDPSRENISRRLGEQHKVRNFYNNMLDPADPMSVTIDTHAVAAALLQPLAGASDEVLHNFGGGGAAQSSVYGTQGTYGFYAEAYRRAAQERGLLPREMQSITWEQVRVLFPAEAKAGLVDAARAIWENYRRGAITENAARKQILKLAGKPAGPEWGSAARGHEAARPSTYAGDVSEPGVPGGGARPAARGTGGGTPRGIPVQGFFDRIEQAARSRLQERGTLTGQRLGAGLDPQDIADVVIIGAAKVAKGVSTFAAWSREMIDEYGDKVRPYLKDLYVKSVAEAGRKMGLAASVMKEGLRSMTVDAVLQQAEAEAGAEPLLRAPLEGTTPDAFEKYQALSRLSADRRRAGLEDAIARSLERMRTADREAIRAEVAPQIEGQHDYRALNALKTGQTPDGAPIPRLDAAALRQTYGAFKDSPELQALRTLDLYRDKGGIDPETAADRLGYRSADEMVQALTALPPLDQAINDAVEAQLRERYPDMTTGEAADQARELATDVGQSEVVAAEMRMLRNALRAERKGRGEAGEALRIPMATVKDARLAAETEIGAMRIRDLTPGLYRAAAKRETARAQEAVNAGDFAQAFAAEQRKLMNLEKHRAATTAIREAEKIADNQRSYDQPRKRARIAKSGQSYLDRIDAYRNGADFARVTNKALDKQESLQQFIQRETEKKLPVHADTLNAVQEGKSYRDMTLDELRALDAAVEHVDHLSKLKTDLMTSAKKRDFEEVSGEIVQSVTESQPRVRKDPRITGADATLAHQMMKKVRRFNAFHRSASSLAFELDGFREGPLRQAFIQTATDAGIHEAQLLDEAAARLTGLLDPVVKLGGMSGRGVWFPSIGRSLNRTKRIVIALQMGTQTGQQRLLGGEGWKLAQVQPVLDSLGRAELDLVQGVFNHFETYVKEAGELERQTTGNQPEWLEPTPIVTQNGTVPGGYYPVKYDLERSPKAERQSAAAEAQALLEGAYTSSNTRQTYLKSRVPEVHNRPIDYASLRGLTQGTNEVIHDLAWRRWLIDATRLMRDAGIDKAIRDRKGAEGVKVFKSWIEDVAQGDSHAEHVLDEAANFVRRGVTTATLAFRLASGLKQLPDLAFSASRIGKGWVARGVMQTMASPRETMKFVNEDPLMRKRGEHLTRDIHDVQKKVQGEGPVKRAIYGSFFIFNRVFQQMVDVPTYVAQYNKSMWEHGDVEQARREARQTVIDTQGSSEGQNLPAVMRAGPAWKLLTMFYHGFAIQHQAVAERTQRGMRVFQSEVPTAKKAAEAVALATDYLMIYGTQAAVGAMITKWFYSRDDEEWAKTLIREGLQGLVGQMIGVREFEGALEKLTGLEEYRRDYSGPAAFRAITALERLAEQTHQGEWDKALRHAIVNGAAIVGGLPGAQANATLDAAIALMEGETDNPFTLITGPPEE